MPGPFPNIRTLYDAEVRSKGQDPAKDEGLDPGAWKRIFAKGLPSYSPSDQELANALLEMDADGDKLVTFEEFVTQMTKPQLDKSKKQDTDALFKKWDKSGDSRLSKDEIRQVVGDQYRPETVEKLIQKADEDGDGFISVNEFNTNLFGVE